MTTKHDVCVSVRHLSKKFARSLKRSFVYGAEDIVRAAMGRSGSKQLRPSEFWALKDISFDLERGQSIGIIGLNGSGKTTLLRIISGILQPTLGEVHVNGKIAPMLALGAGFKPVLSGRENIFLNMSLLGIPRKEIQRRFDEVVDFAELWEAIDAPVGNYSSGMRMRLGFSCAVHTNPSILVVDEVLSVGDLKFRVKCRNKINEIRRNGTSMLLVSHSSISIESLANTCLYLNKGRVAAMGSPKEVMRAYEADNIQASISGDAAQLATIETQLPSHEVGGKISVRDVRFVMPGISEAGYWVAGNPGTLEVVLGCTEQVDEISVNVMIFDITHLQGEVAQYIKSSRELGWLRLDSRQATLSLNFNPVGLRPGVYRVKLSISQGEMHDILDAVDNIKLVVSDSGKMTNCLFYQPRDWALQGGEVARPPSAPDSLDIEEAESF